MTVSFRWNETSLSQRQGRIKSVLESRSFYKGKKLVFGHDEKQVPYRYWVALVIDGDDLYVLEAGGDEASFKKVTSNIDDAIRSLSP